MEERRAESAFTTASYPYFTKRDDQIFPNCVILLTVSKFQTLSTALQTSDFTLDDAPRFVGEQMQNAWPLTMRSDVAGSITSFGSRLTSFWAHTETTRNTKVAHLKAIVLPILQVTKLIGRRRQRRPAVSVPESSYTAGGYTDAVNTAIVSRFFN